MPVYLTVEELARYMHMPTSIVDNDLAEFTLDVAEDIVKDYLEHEPVETEVTEVLDGNNGEALLLTGFPVTEVTSVTEVDALLVVDESYSIDINKGILYRIGANWTPGVQNIIVVYKYGPDTVPNRVKVVGYGIASRTYQHGQSEAESTGAWSATYVKGGARIIEDEQHILRSLKR